LKLNLGSVFQFYRRQEIWTILFYDLTKKESRDLKEEYSTLASKMYGIIKVGAIDCHEEEELCEEFQVYDSNPPVVKIFTEYAADDGVKHMGKMEWKSISNTAASKMQSFVSIVNKDNYQKFIDQDPNKNKILIFTDRKTTAPLFKSLSKTYKDKLTFGEVKKGEEELYAKFGVT
jgi:protein disulfide-isomerase A6